MKMNMMSSRSSVGSKAWKRSRQDTAALKAVLECLRC
jgi:hypothetical protein